MQRLLHYVYDTQFCGKKMSATNESLKRYYSYNTHPLSSTSVIQQKSCLVNKDDQTHKCNQLNMPTFGYY